MKPKKTLARRPVAPAATTACFFMAAVLAIYEKEGAQKQRHLNVLIETDMVDITKEALGGIQRGAMQRMAAENAVTPEQIKDIVILGITFLGRMDPEVFHGSGSVAPLDAPAQGTA